MRSIGKARVATAAAGVVALELVVTAGLVRAAPTAPSGCAPVTVVAIAGTTETNPNADPDRAAGTFSQVTDPLKAKLGNKVRIRYPAYSASAFDKGLTYAASKETGVRAARDEVAAIARTCPGTKFILGGFSQGADVAMDLAVDIGNGRGPVPPEAVLAVGTISDPGQGTPGQVLVGPPVQGQGIAGPRPEGVGALKGRVATICRAQPVDLYCATNRAKDGLLASLGSVLSKSTPGQANAPTGDLGSALVSDFTGADLGALPAATQTLGTELSSPTGQFDPSKVSDAASTIVTTLRPIQDVVSSVANNPGTTAMLSDAPAGSPQAIAGQALEVIKQVDLGSVLDNATRILTGAQAASVKPTPDAQSGPGTAPPATAPAGPLSQNAADLTQQVAPLTQMPSDALSTATSILSTLKPATVVNQLLNAGVGVTNFAANVPAILDALFVQLPQKILALDIPGAHQICGQLNNLFQPLVRMAAGVDLGWIGQIVGMIPDPSGFTQIASMVLGLLGNLDVVRLANDIGQLQEIAWRALEALTSNRLLDIPGALLGLLPVGLDIASVVFGVIAGDGQKTDPAMLGRLNPANQAAAPVAGQASPGQLPGLTKSLSDLATSQGAQDLQHLVSQGLDAASFFASNAHNLYSDYVVDRAGRTAPVWMADWFAQQAAKAR